MNKRDKTFNLIVAGYGGQGVLTLAKIIARAAFFAGDDVKLTAKSFHCYPIILAGVVLEHP